MFNVSKLQSHASAAICAFFFSAIFIGASIGPAEAASLMI